MDTEKYLVRIKYFRTPKVNAEYLADLHQHHLFHIPFENLDIIYGKRISLDLERVYEKIVLNRRGGFCYELNYLFQWLLTELGFNSRMISARVINDAGEPGPEFDHMAIYIDGGVNYLADVGFGDLFLKPLEFKIDKVQYDGRNYFRIQDQGKEGYLLMMSADGIQFKSEYIFNLKKRTIQDFMSLCKDKQVNPDSHFVKTRICTKFTPEGRWTIRNDQWVETINNIKSGFQIETEHELQQLLLHKFEIKI
jgi:N-hydroxyarylamine O-acetyltransferase